MKSVYF